MIRKLKFLAVAAISASSLMGGIANAQWVTLSKSGTIFSSINPKTNVAGTPTCTNTGAPLPAALQPTKTQSSTLATGKFTGLPGSAALPGYILVRQTSPAAQTITVNSTNVGNLYARVYCAGSGSTCSTSGGKGTYIFATRAILNATPANANSSTFETNDFFLISVPAAVSVDVGYYMGQSGGAAPDNSQAFKYLDVAGQASSGLGQADTRDNTYVAFRADTNANDPDRCEPYSRNSPNSPWLYAKMLCSSVAAATSTFKIKLRQGNEEGQGVFSTSLPGFVCTQ